MAEGSADEKGWGARYVNSSGPYGKMLRFPIETELIRVSGEMSSEYNILIIYTFIYYQLLKRYYYNTFFIRMVIATTFCG